MAEFDIVDLSGEEELRERVKVLEAQLKDARAESEYKRRVHADAIATLVSVTNSLKGVAP